MVEPTSFSTSLQLPPTCLRYTPPDSYMSQTSAARHTGLFRRLPTRNLDIALQCNRHTLASIAMKKSSCEMKGREREDVKTALRRLLCRKMGGNAQEMSLEQGRWVKLICGASFEDTAQVRNLSLLYTLAGVDCIDGAADRAVVLAIESGIAAAQYIALEAEVISDASQMSPWIMVSINDDQDIHFRKAEFDPQRCPERCPRPCERVCPAAAIVFESKKYAMADLGEERDKGHAAGKDGVIAERCYGCGRCLPVCPLGLIKARNYVRDVTEVASLLRGGHVDALEIHTSDGHLAAFQKLWSELGPDLQQLKLVAVSLPDMEKLEETMWEMYTCMQPLRPHLLWQLDGRPMSGDIGRGTSNAAVSLAKRVLAFHNRPPGFIQLAGGTNAGTFPALLRSGLLSPLQLQTTGGGTPVDCSTPLPHIGTGGRASIAGVAYGGYARKVVGNVLSRLGLQMNNKAADTRLEYYPSLLEEGLTEAIQLLGPFRG